MQNFQASRPVWAAFIGAFMLAGCTASPISETALNASNTAGNTFALATKRTQAPAATASNKKPKSSASQSRERKKAELERAKKRLESERKKVAAYDRMTGSLGEQQLAFLAPQREMLSKGAKEAEKEVRKLEASLRPKTVLRGGGKGRYNSLIAKYAAANGVPLRLAHAVVRVESSYRANARGQAGEIGLMQIKLSTARMMGYKGSARGLYDPATNIRYGMKYLGKAHKLAGGSTCGTILRYNAGHGAKRMNPISQRYCNRVKRYI